MDPNNAFILGMAFGVALSALGVIWSFLAKR